MIVQGRVKGYKGNDILIVATVPDIEQFKKEKMFDCEIRLEDSRTITTKQRNLIFAFMREISEWSGFTVKETVIAMKEGFCLQYDISNFSLSNVSVSTARDFIEFLVIFCLENDIATKESLLYRSRDISNLLYNSVMLRKCAICRKKADIHEYDRVGMGRNREGIVHIGQRVQPLCREHHNECHMIGQDTFDAKYQLSWIELNEELCKAIGWSAKTS